MWCSIAKWVNVNCVFGMVLGRAIVLDWAVAKEKYTTARTLVCPISFECSIIIVGIMLQKQVLKHMYIIFSSTDKDKKTSSFINRAPPSNLWSFSSNKNFSVIHKVWRNEEQLGLNYHTFNSSIKCIRME